MKLICTRLTSCLRLNLISVSLGVAWTVVWWWYTWCQDDHSSHHGWGYQT